MTIRVSMLVVSLLAVWTVGASTHTPTQASTVESVTERVFAAWDVPGAAVVVVKDGQVVLQKGYGVVGGTGPRTAVTEATAFYTASVTKTFTVAALGMLADEGKFRLDDPVVKYLPDFGAGGAALATQLSVRDLMAHRTGLGRADLLMFSGLTDNEVIARLAGVTPSAPVRSRFTYQNQMYLALGEMAARLSGTSWTQLVTDRVLGPLGMTHSSATGLGHVPPGQAQAFPHARVDGRIVPVDLVPRSPYGAGGINSSARDMATWLQFLLGDGTWKGAKLLGPQVIAATRQPQIVTPQAYFAPDSVLSAYGLGWFLNDHHGHLIVQHGGNGEGWTSLVWLQPDQKLGVAVLTNMHNTMMPWAMAYAVADVYAGTTTRDWTTFYQTVERARDAAAAKQAPVALATPVDTAAWIGTYVSPVYGELRIIATPAGPEVQDGPSLRAPIKSVTGGVAAFWQRSDILAVLGPSPLRLTSRGDDTRLQLQLGGDTVEFIRAR